jgi:hypothetical protein
MAGYCERHGFHKTPRLFGLCQTREDYRELFDRQAKATANGVDLTSPAPQEPDFGPGTELRSILESLRLSELPGCGCKSKTRQMDRWGVEGCREHFEEIVGWMREGYEKAGWIPKAKAAVFAATSGLALKLNPLDPFPSLVQEAILRAEEKATGQPCPA